MRTHRNNPDSPEMQRADSDNRRAVFAAKMQAKLDACDHEEHDHGHCIECGADLTDTLVGQAEDAADAAQDR